MRWALIVIALIVAFPVASAQQQDSAGKSDVWCQELANVALVVNAGSMCLHVQYEHVAGRVGDVVQYAGIVNMPLLGASAMPMGTAVFTPANGCTASALTTGFTNAATGANFRFRGTLTLTGSTCTGYVEITIQLTAIITAAIWWYPITITSNEPNLSGAVDTPDVAAAITDFTDTLCRPTGNHGHCELDIHGGIDVNEAEACGAVTPCLISGDLGFSGNFTQNNNATSDFERVFVYWFPLWMGVVMIFIAIRRREAVEPNALMIGGVLLAIAAIVCPFPGHPQWIDPVGLAMRFSIAGIAIWCWTRYATARKDWNTGEDAQ